MDIIQDKRAAYGLKNFFKQINQRPIAYYPVYRKITGSTTAGILLSQLMYWYGVIKGDVFYKTDFEIMQETLLTSNELRKAKNELKKSGVVSIFLKGVPAKTHYKINIEELYEKIESLSFVESTKLDSLNPRNCDSEIHETITETTTENINISAQAREKAQNQETSRDNNIIRLEQPTSEIRCSGLRQKGLNSAEWVDEFKGLREKYYKSRPTYDFALMGPVNNFVQDWLSQGGDLSDALVNYAYYLSKKEEAFVGHPFHLFVKHYERIDAKRRVNAKKIFEDLAKKEPVRTERYIPKIGPIV